MAQTRSTHELASEWVATRGIDPVENHAATERVLEHLFGRPPAPATVGRYALLEKIGHGGFGRVYRAYDPELAREVAVKLLLPTTRATAQFIAQSLVEARMIARLRHPAVVSVYDVGTVDARSFLGGDLGEALYIVMELVGGTTLRDWLAHEEHSLAEIMAAFVSAGEGLAAAHDAGVAHLDFKPDNVRVDGSRVCVLDFGLSKLVASPADVDGLTAAGTPPYMAPEQHTPGSHGPAADQFALAAALYEALAGQRPFAGATLDELLRAKLRGPPSLSARPGVPRRVAEAVERALRPDPADRFPSMRALLAQLRPRPWRWRSAAVVALVSLGFGVAVHELGTRATACDWVDERAQALWSPKTQERVGAAFAATDMVYARESLQIVQHAMTDFAQQWGDARRSTCQATTTHEPTPEEARQALCLDRLYERAGEVVTRLAEADVEVVLHSARLLEIVTTPAECTREREPAPLPAWVHEHAAEGLVIDASIGRARALRATGSAVLARATAEEALARAEALGADDLAAEAAGVGCWDRNQMESRELVLEACQRALVYAERAAQDDLAARAATAIARAHRDDPPVMQHYLALAEAKAHRLGPSPLVEAEVFQVRGIAALGRGSPDAEALLEQARERYEVALGPDSFELARVSNELGLFHLGHGQYEEARQDFERALEQVVRTRGAQHPDAGQLINNLGHQKLLTEHLDEAVQLLDRALAIKLEGHDSRTQSVIGTRLKLSRAHRLRGDPSAAVEHAARAVELGHSAGLDPSLLALPEGILLDLRRTPGDVEACPQLDALYDRCGGKSEYRRELVVATGKCWIEAGQPARSLARLEAEVRIMDDDLAVPLDAAEVRLTLAAAYRRLGRDDAAMPLLEAVEDAPGVHRSQRERARALRSMPPEPRPLDVHAPDPEPTLAERR